MFRRLAFTALGALAATSAYAGGVSYLRSQIFPADMTPARPLDIDGVAFRVERVVRHDGAPLDGLVATSPGAKAVVIFLHGNGGSAAAAALAVAGLARAGYDLIVADYRGYGGNPGSPSEDALREDASAFLDLAVARAAGRPVLLIGHSLGGAVAILLARRAGVSGLLTLNAVARLADLVPPIGRPFLRDGFDALAAAPTVSTPWIIAHGVLDEIVPCSDATRLAAAAGRPDRVLVMQPGVGHGVDPAALLGLTDRLYVMATTSAERERQATARKASDAFRPPNANEFDNATGIAISRAELGT